MVCTISNCRTVHVVYRGHGGDSHVMYEVHNFIHGGTTYRYLYIYRDQLAPARPITQYGSTVYVGGQAL